MNISSEVQGRHTVGDKTCGCQPSGLRHIFILSAMSLSLALLFPKDSKKTILTQKAGLLTCPLYPESPSHSSNSGFVGSETALYECF